MALEKTTIIEARNIKKYFSIGKGNSKNVHKLHAVDNISLSIKQGEIFGVVGESGSGKSTMGRCLINLLNIDDGIVTFKGQRIDDLKGKKLEECRRNMQMVFQNPFSSFNPRKRLGQAVMEIAKVHVKDKTKKEKEDFLKELMAMVNLPLDILERYPSELSGGQLQRFAILRALYLEPEFLVADEAVSALDVSVQAQILNLFMELREKLDLTILFISHELTVVEHICDKVAVLYLGALMEMADTEELMENILHPYTLALLSAKPRETPEEEKNSIVLEGNIPNAVDIPDCCRFHERCFKAKKGICDCKTPEYREIKKGHFVACHFPLTKEERYELQKYGIQKKEGGSNEKN